MPLKITNASGGLVLIRMRSGQTIYLGAGEQTGMLPEDEITGNPRIEPLRERGLISVETVSSGRQRRANPAADKTSDNAAGEGGSAT